MQRSPVPDPGRSHDVRGLTTAELERIRRELRASLGLARPGSTACVPMLAHLSAINTELGRRSSGCGTSVEPRRIPGRSPVLVRVLGQAKWAVARGRGRSRL